MPGYVLIVEKDAELQERIGAALREGGYEMASETEGTWAKRSIAVRKPDALIVGTRLGDGDGFALAEELRREPETRALPIVFVATTHRGTSHRAEARRRFAPADYLATPLDPQQIVPRLAELAAAPPVVAQAEDATPPPVPKGSLRDPAQQRERRDVERSARNLVDDPAQAEFSGTLKRTPLARVLQRLYATRATGSLLLLREATKKIVLLADGYPVSARSNLLGECLGQILLEKKLITREALAASVSRMQREKRQQGQILIEMGVLSPHNLQRALVDQIEAKLLEVFTWPDGKFMFRTSHVPSLATRLERPPAAFILEGIRRHYDESRQKSVLARYTGQFVALVADPMLRLQEMTADSSELAFIREIDGTRQLEEILAYAKIPTPKARLLVVALSEAGMIQPQEATSRRRAPVNGTAPAATPPSDRQPSALGSGELSMMLQMARTQDHFWALGVGHETSGAEIDRAYEALARSFHADRYRLAPDEDRKMAQEIFEALTEAHRVLKDPARRRAYLAKLGDAQLGEEEPAPLTHDTVVEPIPTPIRAVSSSPGGAAHSLYEVGLEHLRARRHHEAVEVLRQAARLVPNEADYRAALGWALFRQAPADARAARAAIAELRRATQIDERSRTAAQHLAEIYAQTGQAEAAITELERLLVLDPGAVELAEELRRLRGQ